MLVCTSDPRIQCKMSSDTAESSRVEGEGRDEPSPEHLRHDLEEKFNAQRAKMKELFLQKEGDMRKLLQDKEQLESEVLGLRASLQQLQTLSENQKSEIQSLQLLVNETVEASSTGNDEVRRLRAKNIELEHQMGQLRQQQQQQEVSLAPATIVRNLARKLGADSDDQPVRKNVEDNDLARSMIQPMELEIAALKNKLRETDSQLQEALKTLSAAPANTGVAGDTKNESEAPRQCDMCANYEKQLVSEQAKAEAAKERVFMLDIALKQATEELEGVRSLHDETVRNWHAARAETGQALIELRDAVAEAVDTQRERSAAADAAEQRALAAVTALTVKRETLQKKLDSLERDNAMLIGQYLKKAEEMQNEIIDLPDNVVELQELTLRLREQLIFCQIGREESAQAERELRAQLLEQGSMFQQQEMQLSALRAKNKSTTEILDRLQVETDQMKELGNNLRQSNDTIQQLLGEKKRLQCEVQELRKRVSVLQQELDNSEKVQQDFVRLSQSLQVQLQRIREADTEVRWQHDDDVSECPSCHAHLQNHKKKVHCRHCGRIFCAACVSHTVPSGPRRAPARVCTVCRTLLQPHTAPYFSTEPPRSPD